jgi:hypothetical protein
MFWFHVARIALVLLTGLQQSLPAISAPANGQTLTGTVEITGALDSADFRSAELSFGYASDPTDTWFTIQSFTEPIGPGVLATWDTSLVTDGDYRLRLRQVRLDGSFADFQVEDLHLRNNTPTETPTPSQAQPSPTATQTEMVPDASEPPVETTAVPAASGAPDRPTPLPLPSNPAAIGSGAVYSIFARGALLALILFIVLGVFLQLRRR